VVDPALGACRRWGRGVDMGFVTFLFGIAVLFTGVPAFWQLGIGLGLAGTIAPALAYLGAGGATSALRIREGTRATIPVALIMIGVAFFWVSRAGWHLLIFHHDISGTVEIIVSVVLGAAFGMNRELNPAGPLR